MRGRGLSGGHPDLCCRGASSGISLSLFILSGSYYLTGCFMQIARATYSRSVRLCCSFRGLCVSSFSGETWRGKGCCGAGWRQRAGADASTCAGGSTTLCHWSRRLYSIWLSWVVWAIAWGRELATRASRSLAWRRSSSVALPMVDMAWTREPRRGRIVHAARERSPIPWREGRGSCSGDRPVIWRVFRGRCLRWRPPRRRPLWRRLLRGGPRSESRTRQNQAEP